MNFSTGFRPAPPPLRVPWTPPGINLVCVLPPGNGAVNFSLVYAELLSKEQPSSAEMDGKEKGRGLRRRGGIQQRKRRHGASGPWRPDSTVPHTGIHTTGCLKAPIRFIRAIRKGVGAWEDDSLQKVPAAHA